MEHRNCKYIFIDECGDPDFYGKRGKLLVGQKGFQPLLIEGMIVSDDRKYLRKKVLEFQGSVKNDELYNSIYSIKQAGWYLHAKDDHPEVRAKFFELLRELKGYKCFVVIGRKKLDLFNNKHNKNPQEFYFDVLYHLLKDRLNEEKIYYRLFLAGRQKTNNKKFSDAVSKALMRDNDRRKTAKDISYSCDVVKSSEFPEISIIDYLLWALQRYILKNEGRFYKALIEKYSLIIDLYDTGHYESNYYNSSNRFDLAKASSFV